MVETIKEWIKRNFGDIQNAEFFDDEDLDDGYESSDEYLAGTEDWDNPQETKGQIIAFMSGKGGAGKTGIAINVANYCAENGKKVLLVDCDMNTNGATAFFRTGNSDLFDHLENILTLHSIISEYQVDSNIRPAEIPLTLEPLQVKEDYDFIPANVEDGDFDDQNVTNDLLQKFEEHYISRWRTTYDVIIMDFGAGGAAITDCLSQLPDKICIVMNPDRICRRIVRTKLRFVFQKCNLNKVVCCINKRKRFKRYVNTGALFNEFSGFSNSKKYADLYESGRMIEFTNYILWRQLSKIAYRIL